MKSALMAPGALQLGRFPDRTMAADGLGADTAPNCPAGALAPWRARGSDTESASASRVASTNQQVRGQLPSPRPRARQSRDGGKTVGCQAEQTVGSGSRGGRNGCAEAATEARESEAVQLSRGGPNFCAQVTN